MSTHAVSTSTASPRGIPLMGETLQVITAAREEIAKQRTEIGKIKFICTFIIEEIAAISQSIVSGQLDYTMGAREENLNRNVDYLVGHGIKILEAEEKVTTQEAIIATAEALRSLTIPAMQQVPELRIAPPGILPLIVGYLE